MGDNNIIVTRKSAAAITALQLVKFDSNGKVTPCTTAGEKADGIAQRAAAGADEAVEVAIFGLTKAVAGADLTEGGLVMTNASGRVIDYLASGGGANEYAIGRWLPNVNHTTTADGEEVFILFTGASEFGA